jgi:hypothetical protein
MNFQAEGDVRAYWKAAKRDWWAGRISRAEYHKRIHESVTTFHREQNAIKIRELIQWLNNHDAEWEFTVSPVPTNILKEQVRFLRSYLEQSNMTAEEFLTQLIDAYEQYAPRTDTEELFRKCVVKHLKSIQKGVTVQ